MQEEFGPDEFGVEQLLPESRQKIFKQVFGTLVERFSEQYVRLYEDNRRNLEMLQSVGFELPREIRARPNSLLANYSKKKFKSGNGIRDRKLTRT